MKKHLSDVFNFSVIKNLLSSLTPTSSSCQNRGVWQDIYGKSIFIVFIILVLSDFLTIKYPSVGKFGVIFWYVSYIFFIAYACKSFFDFLRFFPQGKAIFTTLALLVFGIVMITNAPLSKYLSAETTQEIDCTLNLLSNSNDWGYRQTCHLGYPARQFYLPSIFSKIGRNLIALQLGGNIYLIIGLIIFASGSLRFHGYSRFGDLVTALSFSFLFHSRFFNFLSFSGEQSIYPTAFSLIMVGLFLSYLKNKNTIPLGMFAILIQYLIFSYTPSLSLLFLCLMILVSFSFKRNVTLSSRLTYLFIVIVCLASFYLSLKYRSDIKLIDADQGNTSSTISQLTDKTLLIIKHLIFQSEGVDTISPLFNFPFIAILTISLTTIFGWEFSILSFWIIGTIILGGISQGYAPPAMNFALHRGTLVFPVFMGMFTTLSNRLPNNKTVLSCLLILTVLFISTGICYQKRINLNKTPNLHYQLIEWLKPQLKTVENKEEIIYFVGSTFDQFISLNDSLAYFIPYLKSKKSTENEMSVDCQILKRGIFIISKSDPCYLKLFSQDNSKNNVLGANNVSTDEIIDNLAIIKSY